MKILFLFRSSFEAAYILSKINIKKSEYLAIIESGTKAKQRKLKRTFQQSPFYLYPFICLDILSLILYSYVQEIALRKILGTVNYPPDVVKLEVNDANSIECIDFIQHYRPDIIFIYGTAILSKNFLQKVKTTILNIHSGILPKYRNVHSEFWAFLNNDYQNIGITIFHVDEGIDTGSIALEKKIVASKNDNLANLQAKNLANIPELIAQAIQEFMKGKLKKERQPALGSGFYRTPRLIDIVRFSLKVIKLKFFT